MAALNMITLYKGEERKKSQQDIVKIKAQRLRRAPSEGQRLVRIRWSSEKPASCLLSGREGELTSVDVGGKQQT